MGKIPHWVQLVGYDRESCRLLQVQIGSRDKVPSGKEVLHLFSDTRLRVEQLFEVVWIPDLCAIEFRTLQVFDYFRFGPNKKII